DCGMLMTAEAARDWPGRHSSHSPCGLCLHGISISSVPIRANGNAPGHRIIIRTPATEAARPAAVPRLQLRPQRTATASTTEPLLDLSKEVRTCVSADPEVCWLCGWIRRT